MDSNYKSFLVALLFFVVSCISLMLVLYFTTAITMSAILSVVVFCFYKKYIFEEDNENEETRSNL